MPIKRRAARRSSRVLSLLMAAAATLGVSACAQMPSPEAPEQAKAANKKGVRSEWH